MRYTHPPAALRLRFAALCIDLCIIVLYALCLLGITLTFYEFTFGGVPDALNGLGVNGAHLLGFTTLTFPVGLYFFFAETSRHHATWGKRAVKIKVITKEGKKSLSKKQIALRTIIKLLPWEFAHTFVYQVIYYSNNNIETPAWVMIGLYIANVLPLVYVLMIVFRKDRAGPHDLAAKTLVTTR